MMCLKLFAEVSESLETIEEPTPPPAPVAPVIGEETFQIVENKRYLDIIWIVDNSGSMANEIKQVKKNLDLFVDSLEKFSNVQLSLMSNDNKDHGSNTMDLTR